MIRYERRAIAELLPNKQNPRRISKKARAALATSVRRFGLVQPIVLNERTGRVVGGHQRLDVLREQGVVEVDVAIGSWSDAEERVLNVALNNPNAQGEFTDVREFVAEALSVLSLDDFETLQLGDLVLDRSSKTEQKRRDDKTLEYKLVITARDEAHQCELLERLEADGLDVKLLIV
jgi:hypothetical protein